MATDERTRVLMVAEKPSLAKSIASILSNNKAAHSLRKLLEVHEYSGRFLQFGDARFSVTSVIGHVLSVDFPGHYQSWEKTDPASLFGAQTIKKEANPKARVVQHLNSEAKGCDYLVLWLDCDREGENICFEVIEQTMPFMRKKKGQQIFRAKFSAISEPEIRQAMRNLGLPNEREALAVDGRQELDLKVGVAFTRFQTRFFQGKYGNLDASLISYGPCQIPTLNFCVERHQAINEFQPEQFWLLKLIINKGGVDVVFNWERGRIFDEAIVFLYQSSVKNSKSLTITSVKESVEHRRRPHGLNTVEMLKVASSGLNMGPHHAMQIAERLYTQGYISYPRTESSRYPPNYDFQSVLRTHQRHAIWGNYALQLLRDGFSIPEGGIDAGDHPPISPVECATEAELGSDAWRLYDYIARHFLASLSPNAVYQKTEVIGKSSTEIFKASGIQLVKEGFTTVMPWKRMEGQPIPEFKQGESVHVKEVEMVSGRTTAPNYLSEADLISCMEKNGIGTDASISVHINNICERNYVRIESGRRVVPTELGITLIKGYQSIDPELCRPQVRAYVEKQIDLIAKGKAEKSAVVEHVLNQFLQKFKFFVTHISRMDALFEASFSPLSATGKLFGKCGKCKRYMMYIQSRPSRLYCQTCEDIYRLPQGGNIKQYKGLECPLDGFELVLFSLGGIDGKTFPLCPYCFSNPPFEGALKVGENLGKPGMACSTCLHPTCAHSACSQGVCSCPHCDVGTLVLDPVSAPEWRIDCNKWLKSSSMRLVMNLYSVKVSKDRCEDCTSSMIVLNWKKGASSFTDNGNERSCCIICDDEIRAICSIKHGRTFIARGGRGRGRNRSRGKGRARHKDYDPLMSFRDF